MAKARGQIASALGVAVALALPLALVLASSGCQSCADERGASTGAQASAGPTMPTGLLVPGASARASTEAGSLRIARGVKAGPWTELQIAAPGDTAERTHFEHWRDDSSFVSLEAMTQMHEAFARALPGFDLFLPRLFSPDALVKLGAELTSFASAASGDIATTAREIALAAAAAAADKQSLWVLGP